MSRCISKVFVYFPDFLLCVTLKKVKLNDFSSAEITGWRKAIACEDNRLTAYRDTIFIVRVCVIFIWHTEQAKFFFCEVFKGDFLLTLSVPIPLCVDSRIAYHDFSGTVKSIHDVFFVCFCANYRKYPFLSDTKSIDGLFYVEYKKPRF